MTDPLNEAQFFAALRGAFKYPPIPGEYVPMSVRHGSRRKRVGWMIASWREAVALRLAPWLTPDRF